MENMDNKEKLTANDIALMMLNDDDEVVKEVKEILLENQLFDIDRVNLLDYDKTTIVIGKPYESYVGYERLILLFLEQHDENHIWKPQSQWFLCIDDAKIDRFILKVENLDSDKVTNIEINFDITVPFNTL